MVKATLRQLYEQHEGKLSDKWEIYLTEYDRLFSGYRDRQVRLLEIGIQNGGSLDIWSKYFPQAHSIVGCDINQDCAKLVYKDSRIAVVVGDANSDESERAIASISPQFDLIIDDGSHVSGDIIRTFVRYFPRLVDGGLFIAEDLHCSYWASFQGGLFDPASSIAFFKRLADVISHEHWGVPTARKDILASFARIYKFDIDEELLGHIHSVEFINSLCVIHKNVPAANVLGARFISGNDEIVVGGHKPLHLTQASAIDGRGNHWFARAQLPEDEHKANTAELAQLRTLSKKIASLNQSVLERDGQIASFSQVVTERDKQLASLSLQVEALRNSSSWKITAPLRWVAHQGKRALLLATLAPRALKLGGGLSATLNKAMALYRREGVTGLKRGLIRVRTYGVINPAAATESFDRNDYTEWVRRYDTLTPVQLATMRQQAAQFTSHPLISVIMPVYNPNPAWLQEAIESVQRQIYPHWELCIADDASTDVHIKPLLQKLAAADSRIKVVFRPENGHISAASNSALEVATGKWLALLDHDDLLPDHSLFWVAHAISQQPDAKLIYSDEDKIDDVGKRSSPYFKCDWNIDLFYSHNMFCHLGVYAADVVRAVGGFRLGYEGSQDYDLALRCVEQVGTQAIHHIPRVLYHWRMHAQSTAHNGEAKPYAVLAGERALTDHFQRTQTAGRAEWVGVGYRAHYDLPSAAPLVSIIIPTRNGLSLLRQCIDSVVQKTTYAYYEILVVDNGSDDAETLTYMAALAEQPNIRILRDERPFNYSALNNMAVQAARGQVLVLLNNDIEVISPDWLTQMVSLAVLPSVGAVGAKLYYSNNQIQHAGVVLGVGGVAGHAHKYFSRTEHGYFSRAVVQQGFSAVTGACLVVEASKYKQVGGLNEAQLAVAFNDVDFCLKLLRAGYRNVWTAYAELYHHESATRGAEDNPEKVARFNGEVAYMKATWATLLKNDPAYSPNLTLDFEDFSLAWPPRI